MTLPQIYGGAKIALEEPDHVYDVRGLDGMTFSVWAVETYEQLLTIEETVATGIHGRMDLLSESSKWVALLGSANAHAGRSRGFYKRAEGLLTSYFRKVERLTPLEAGRESKIYLGSFEELSRRWEGAARSLQELIWQANRILKPLENEQRSQGRAAS